MSTTYDFLVPLPMHEECIVDHLTGTGWYEWFNDVDFQVIDEVLTLVVTGDDNGDGESFRVEATIPHIVRTLNAVIAEKGDCWESLVRAIREDDFDMNDTDVALQYIAFGQLVFG